MNGHATLWTGNDVIEGRGRNYIGNNCTVHFWELKGVKESVIKDAYFAKKEVVVVEQDGQMKEEIHFFPISSSLIGKMVYLIVETKNMSGQKLRVSIQDASDKEVYMVEHAKDLGILNSLDDNEGERHHYVNLERDHADKVIVKFQIGSADRVVFDRLAQKIGSRTGATRFEIVVKTDDEQPVYYGNNTRNKSNEGTFLQAGSDNCFTVGSAIRTTTDAGHGDWAVGLAYFDPGAVDGDHLEKDYALKVEEATARWLQTFGGIDNHRMREGDVDKRPAKRQVWRYTETSLNKSKIFVSFHLDSGSKDGFFIIYPQKPATQKSDETFGEYQRKVARSENGQRLAQFIKDNMVILRPIENAVRVDTRPTQLPVLREFNGEAAVLIELCGIGSSTGRELINNYFNEIGRSIAIGIYKYLFNNEDPD
jgi:N-acetylmuramoyl-L-alanine amidase